VLLVKNQHFMHNHVTCNNITVSLCASHLQATTVAKIKMKEVNDAKTMSVCRTSESTNQNHELLE